MLMGKNGKNIPVSDSISPIKDQKNKIRGCVVVFSDDSKEREIDEAKTNFVSLASHQLRTPISSESWFLEMLLSGEVGSLNEKQKDYAQEAYSLNKRLGKIVSMLLNVSRIEMGEITVEPVSVDMEKVINETLSSITPLTLEKNIWIEKKMEKDLPIINADPKLIGIVIDNLVANAVQYTGKDGHITVSVQKIASDIVVEITDDGIGIPKNDQPKMFSKLFRADNAKEIYTEGNGLGLYMTKSIVESWGGTIRFVSPVGSKTESEEKEKRLGTSFFVTVPLLGMEKRKGNTEIIKV